MSKRTRRDELTGRLTESQRRKRRSLDPLAYTDTSLTLSTGGTGGSTCGCPSTCPEEGVNFGPADARLEWYTAQSTGTVVGHVYEDVHLESMGFVPGDDVISYCYSARIGPSTGPIELYCDGKLGRIERGLVATIYPQDAGFFSSSTAIAYWGSSVGWGVGSTEDFSYNTRTDEATGKQVIFLPNNRDGCIDAGGYVAVDIPALTGSSKALAQFSYNRGGVCTGLTNYVDNPANVTCWHANSKDPEDGGTRGNAGLGGAYWGLSRGGGLFATKHFMLGPGGNNQYGTGNPVSIFYDNSTAPTPYFGARAWTTTAYNGSLGFGGSDPLIAASGLTGPEDVLLLGHGGSGLGALTPTTTCTNGIVDMGWYSFYDIYVMRDEKVEWQLNSSGRVAVLGTGGQKTAFAASTADDTTWSHNLWRGSTAWDSYFPSSAPLNGDWGAPYPQKGVKIYNTSTLGTPILNCTEPYIWGGDVWAYSSAGFTISTGGSTCCATYVKLNFVDVDGNILSTYGSTGGTNKYAEQRVTGVENLLIPPEATVARFTQVKTGACSCYGWADDIMFSEGPCCMHYSPPIIVAIREGLVAASSTSDGISVTPAATAITGVYSTGNSTLVSGDDIYDAVQEHSRVNLNVLPEAHAEYCVASATGMVEGDPWPDVVFADLGMSTADTLSFRWKVKVST